MGGFCSTDTIVLLPHIPFPPSSLAAGGQTLEQTLLIREVASPGWHVHIIVPEHSALSYMACR